MTAKKPSKPSKKVVSDVAPPGSVSASPTNRPIILEHKVPLKDPMVQAQEPVKPVEKARTPSVPTKTITPVAETTEPSSPQEQPTAEAVLKNAEATVGTVIQQYRPTSSQDTETVSETVTVESLIASRQYHVPIGKTAAKKAYRTLWIVLVLLLLGLAGWYVWSAGLLTQFL